MAVVDPECRALISEASQTSSAPHADPAEGRQGAAWGVGQRKLASASHTGEAPPFCCSKLTFQPAVSAICLGGMREPSTDQQRRKGGVPAGDYGAAGRADCVYV